MTVPAIYIKGADDANPGTYVTNYLVAAVDVVGVAVLAYYVHRHRTDRLYYDRVLATLFTLMWLTGTISFVAGGLLHEMFYDTSTLAWAVFARLCWGGDIISSGFLAATAAAIVPALRRHRYKLWLVAACCIAAATGATFIYMMIFPVFRIDIWFESGAVGVFVLGLLTKLVVDKPWPTRPVTLLALFGVLVRAAAGIFQFHFESTCGRPIPEGCPFPHDFNHNAIFHIFFAVANALLIYPIVYWLRQADDSRSPLHEYTIVDRALN